MRRGIGVAHVQQKRQQKEQMADLGAMMTAERVALVADQLEALVQQLRDVAAKHKAEIKNDAVVRARFRQLADSLGVDLISSKKNVFAGVLGLGDFYYSLATKVVLICMRERKYCGGFVPVRKVLSELQREEEKFSRDKSSGGSKLTEGDIMMALGKLHILGAGYNMEYIGDVQYIRTTPDGNRGSDDVPLLNFALRKRNERRAQVAAREERAKIGAREAAKDPIPPASRSRLGAPYTPALSQKGRLNVGSDPSAGCCVGSDADQVAPVDFYADCVATTQREVEQGLLWLPHRAQAVLNRLVQDGSVWVDYPEDGKVTTVTPATSPTTGKDAKLRKGKGAGAADGQQPAEDPVFWFVSLTEV